MAFSIVGEITWREDVFDVFRANYSFVVGVAERRLDSKVDAEEIASEAFRLAWQRYDVGEALSVP
ncbi:hypothetical protein [Glutamicibacter sp. NPDC087344]|uniref:hypothetical protein n=1 Tax=Glutamicibacter sp. NPDC087344 TaxID=3363994 RepID=UPI0038301F0D